MYKIAGHGETDDSQECMHWVLASVAKLLNDNMSETAQRDFYVNVAIEQGGRIGISSVRYNDILSLTYEQLRRQVPTPRQEDFVYETFADVVKDVIVNKHTPVMVASPFAYKKFIDKGKFLSLDEGTGARIALNHCRVICDYDNETGDVLMLDCVAGDKWIRMPLEEACKDIGQIAYLTPASPR